MSIEEKKERAQLFYSVSKHHRQLLRTQIAPETIDELQINEHPSQKYRQAYQSLYHDELEKTLLQQRIKKEKQQLEEKQNNEAYQNIRIGTNQFNKSNLISNNNMLQSNNSQLKNNLQSQYKEYYGSPQKNTLQNLDKYKDIRNEFRDYDLEKRAKAQYLINKNIGKGLKIHQDHQNYERGRTLQTISTDNILKQQIGWKQYAKKMQQQHKAQENSHYQAINQRMKQIQETKKMRSMENKQQLRNDIKQQIQQQRVRKQKKSIFLFNNLNRHNPITNPIEYHIDNPYILKKIQDKRNINRN